MARRPAGEVAAVALGAFNDALRLKDRGIAAAFHKSALFIGSEPGEMARGRDGIATLLSGIFASDSTVQFEWASIEAMRTARTVWFFADGHVVITSAAGERRRAYRLSGVLEKTKRDWRWRLFHGSEPWIAPIANPRTGYRYLA
jgi:ketosteroid isomerase-like protein